MSIIGGQIFLFVSVLFFVYIIGDTEVPVLFWEIDNSILSTIGYTSIGIMICSVVLSDLMHKTGLYEKVIDSMLSRIFSLGYGATYIVTVGFGLVVVSSICSYFIGGFLFVFSDSPIKDNDYNYGGNGYEVESNSDSGTHHVSPHYVESYERSDGTQVEGYHRGGEDGYERSDPGSGYDSGDSGGFSGFLDGFVGN